MTVFVKSYIPTARYCNIEFQLSAREKDYESARSTRAAASAIWIMQAMHKVYISNTKKKEWNCTPLSFHDKFLQFWEQNHTAAECIYIDERVHW